MKGGLCQVILLLIFSQLFGVALSQLVRDFSNHFRIQLIEEQRDDREGNTCGRN